MRQVSVRRVAAVLALWASTTFAPLAHAQALAPISYVVRVPAPATHEAMVEATIPTGGQASIDLMMPTWSPGYYRVEDYAANVRAIRPGYGLAPREMPAVIGKIAKTMIPRGTPLAWELVA